jgi:chromosome segregation ATPase
MSGGRFEGFDDRPGAVEGGASSIEDQERIAELEDDIQALREELDKSRQETKTVRSCCQSLRAGTARPRWP